MRIRSAGSVERVDLSPLLDLLPALHDEWTGLDLDAAGRAVDPLTGTPSDRFALVEGRHRRPGARYALAVEHPELELPDHLRSAFDEEQAALATGGTSPEAWSAFHERRRAASVQVGVQRTTLHLTLTHDDPWRTAFTLADEPGRWAVDVDVRHGSAPSAEVSARADLTGLLRDAGSPGCLARVLGGRGEGRAAVDLGALDGRGGSLVDATGTANRFRGRAEVGVRSTRSSWRITVVLVLRARGLGRLALLAFGRRIRRDVGRQLDELWRSAQGGTAGLAAELRELDAEVQRHGGPATFVRRALWDPTFDVTTLGDHDPG